MLTHSFTYLPHQSKKKPLYVSLFYVHIIIHSIPESYTTCYAIWMNIKFWLYFQVKEFLKKEKLKRRCNHCWLLDNMIREYYERCNGVSRLQSKQIVFWVWHYKTAVPISRVSIDGMELLLHNLYIPVLWMNSDSSFWF